MANDNDNALETRVKESLAEVKAEMESTPVAERVPLLYIFQQYETGIVDFAAYCAHPYTSPILIEKIHSNVVSMLNDLNVIGTDVGYWIADLREKASKAGALILSKLLNLICSLVRESLNELILTVKAAGQNLAITSYSIGVTIGGFLTFGINFASTIEGKMSG